MNETAVEPNKDTQKDTKNETSRWNQNAVFRQLPEVNTLPGDAKYKAKIISLLDELQGLDITLSTVNERWEEIEAELEAIQLKAGVDGLRYSNLCYRAVPNKPGKSFKQDKCKELLIEAGVDPLVIRDCFTRALEVTEVKKAYKHEFRQLEDREK